MSTAATSSSRQARENTWIFVPALLAGLLGCTSESAHPAVLSDCIPKGDASCAAPIISGGGGSGPGDGGTSNPFDAGEELEEGGSCGTAGELLNAPNAACLACISTTCCLAASACTGPCLSLVQCPTNSIASCEATYPAGVTAYEDFANCILTCGSCPPLPLASGSDI